MSGSGYPPEVKAWVDAQVAATRRLDATVDSIDRLLDKVGTIGLEAAAANPEAFADEPALGAARRLDALVDAAKVTPAEAEAMLLDAIRSRLRGAGENIPVTDEELARMKNIWEDDVIDLPEAFERRSGLAMREWRRAGLDKPCRACGEPFDQHGMLLLPPAAMPDDAVISCPDAPPRA